MAFKSRKKQVEKHELLATRKSIHVTLTMQAAHEFRLQCVKRGLSQQEVMEEFVQRVALGDLEYLDLLELLVERKRDATVKKLSSFDTEEIFNLIKRGSDSDDD